ncbi:MAG: hypothetical protein ABIH66_13790 [bacterium]
MREKRRQSNKTGGGGEKSLLPTIKKNVWQFLNREEARISDKCLLTGSVVLLGLGIAATEALAAHTSQHNSANRHSNLASHSSTVPHHNVGAGHDSWAPHVNLSPHHSDATLLTTPHVSGHTSNVLSENVTKGALHNDAAAGYGKHSAGTGHRNVNIVDSAVNVDRSADHASVTPHNSTAPHTNLGVGTFNVAPHQSGNTHVNQTLTPTGHYNGAVHASWYINTHNSHSSHGSHGQW